MTAAGTRNRRRYLLPNHWILVTSRTINGRFWFSEFDDHDCRRVFGLLIVALLRYGVDCAAAVVMDNHTHLLLRSRRGGQRISLAMQYFLAGVARLVHAKHGTTGPVWQRGFTAVNLLDREAERSALAYICRHGVAQGLVSRPQDWPLPNTVGALVGDRRLEGLFPDRVDRGQLRRVEVTLSPLTGWHPTSPAYTAFCRALVDDVIAGAPPNLDAANTRRVDHAHVPTRVKRSRLRIFKAGSDARARLLSEAYAARREDVSAAIVAAEFLMRRGVEFAELPEACQWPPFVSEALGLAIAEIPFAAVYAPEPEVA